MDHGTATEGMECACCYDDIVGGKGGNYVEYRTGEGALLIMSCLSTQRGGTSNVVHVVPAPGLRLRGRVVLLIVRSMVLPDFTYLEPSLTP